MKYLNQFIEFDWVSFAKDKKFLAIGKKEWLDYNTKEHLGTKIEAIIYKDNTDYDIKNGEVVSNIYEKLTFKVPKDIEIPINTEIQPKNVEARVYGDFRNQLSIIAEDVIVVSKKEA